MTTSLRAFPALYYSYDLGAWHVVSLASSAGVSPGAGGAEETWLKADLAAHPSQCILAYWHEARFACGTTHGNNTAWGAVWNDLYAAGADLILNGHEHNYERFARQNPSGVADPNGIREIISGTGGIGHYPIGTAKANSEIRNATTFGVLKLTLHAASYDWQFVPVAGSTFTDSGTDTCSGAAPPPPTTTAPTTTAPPPPTTTVPTTTTTPTTTTPTTTPTTTAIPPATTAPSAPVNLRITAGTRTSLTLAWDASTDNVGVTGYRVWRDGTLRLSITGLIYSASSLSCSDKRTAIALRWLLSTRPGTCRRVAIPRGLLLPLVDLPTPSGRLVR